MVPNWNHRCSYIRKLSNFSSSRVSLLFWHLCPARKTQAILLSFRTSRCSFWCSSTREWNTGPTGAWPKPSPRSGRPGGSSAAPPPFPTYSPRTTRADCCSAAHLLTGPTPTSEEDQQQQQQQQQQPWIRRKNQEKKEYFNPSRLRSNKKWANQFFSRTE